MPYRYIYVDSNAYMYVPVCTHTPSGLVDAGFHGAHTLSNDVHVYAVPVFTGNGVYPFHRSVYMHIGSVPDLQLVRTHDVGIR